MPVYSKERGVIAPVDICVDDRFVVHLAALVAGLTTESSIDYAAALRSVADDLDAIRRGDAPTPQQLAIASRLDQWRLAVAPDGLRLSGFATGHPKLGARRVLTSSVFRVDAGFKWARTLSRFYQLGAPDVTDSTPPHCGERRPRDRPN